MWVLTKAKSGVVEWVHSLRGRASQSGAGSLSLQENAAAGVKARPSWLADWRPDLHAAGLRSEPSRPKARAWL